MALHAQRQRLDTLENLERARWAYAGAEVPQAFAPRAQEEGRNGGLLLEIHSVEARVGLGQLRKFPRGFPVERAAVHEHAADRHAVTAEELGGRVIHEIGAVVEGLEEVRRGEGGIHQERQLRGVRDRGDRGNVEHVQPGVAEGLAEKKLGVRPDRLFPGGEIARSYERGFDAEARQSIGEQIVRAAVEGAHTLLSYTLPRFGIETTFV